MPTPWTGSLDFELYTPRGWRTGVAELRVRRDVVEVWTNRMLGTFDRDELRAWLRVHRAPLAADDVIWTVVRQAFAVQLDGSDPYEVPETVTAALLRSL